MSSLLVVVFHLVSDHLLNIFRCTYTFPVLKVQNSVVEPDEQCLLKLCLCCYPWKDIFLSGIYRRWPPYTGLCPQDKGSLKRRMGLSELDRDSLLFHLCNTYLIIYYNSKEWGCYFCLCLRVFFFFHWNSLLYTFLRPGLARVTE